EAQMRIIDRSEVIFALLTYLVTAVTALNVGDRFILDDSIASELEDWELRWLKDAVRRGKAIVSKGIQSNGDFDDDWESFAKSVQAQNARSASHPSPIPAAEPSFLGSFGGSSGPSISIGPPQSGGSASFVPSQLTPNQGNDGFFFGNMDPSMFMQPVIVQQAHSQQAPPPLQ
ncbi:hypothetical protein PMAYCL1PPCAC_03380, partial [Pristionchus mayeri]